MRTLIVWTPVLAFLPIFSDRVTVRFLPTATAATWIVRLPVAFSAFGTFVVAVVATSRPAVAFLSGRPGLRRA